MLLRRLVQFGFESTVLDLLVLDLLLVLLLPLRQPHVQIVQVLCVVVKLDTPLLRLLYHVLSVCASIESCLQSRVCQILLIDHLVERALEELIEMQVLAFLLKVVFRTKLKFYQETHDLSLRINAFVSQHVKFLFL